MCNETNLKGNPVRGRLNALFFTVFDGYINRLTAERKAKLFADLPDTLVELGSGVGANFEYIKPGTKITAVEPNPHMHKELRNKARRRGIELNLPARGAEAMELPDNSVEAVICTLVLCTVPDPVGVLREVRRVLKPGGRFMFIEHVAAPASSWRRGLQNLLQRPWRYLFEGCHTNRDTTAEIEAAGFHSVDIEAYIMNGPFIPVNTQIAGVAVA